jgi:undecaprenyl-diphosphatase
MAVVYADKYPKLTIPLYSFGILVGLSRIYQGQHYPSDVLAGAILGWASGFLTLKLEKKLNRFFER